MGDSPLFGQPGQPRQTPWSGVGLSLTIHLCAIAAIALAPLPQDDAIVTAPRKISTVRLFVPRLYLAPPVRVAKTASPARLRTPSRRFVPKPAVRRHAPTVPMPPSDALVARIPAPLPILKRDLPASIPALKPGWNKAAAPAPKGPVREVRTGGFGDPNGLPASAGARRGLTVARLGSFDLPQGAGSGGAPRGTGVAVGGFGSGTTASGTGTGPGGAGGGVRPTGFEGYGLRPAPPPEVRAPAPPQATPVEILSKPKPAYSDVARAKRLEGEVTLEVLFEANGEIRVLRLLQGLGSGLDQNAESAAVRIRFRPGTRDGHPVDMKGVVHIVFQLL